MPDLYGQPSSDRLSHRPHRILAPIVAHDEVAPSYFRLKFCAPAIARAALAGQFVHLLPAADQAVDPLLRRAFSILAVQDDMVEVLYRVEGRGTAQMATWRVGDVVDALGPLGIPFAPLPASALLVGGGVGVPPLAMLASQHTVVEQTTENREMRALIGARTRSEIICLDDFEQYHVPVEVSTDDGSAGLHGFVTHLLEKRLQEVLPQTKVPTIFSCGPLPMLRAVAAICALHKAPCQVSLEENMPCGVGVCNGCVVPVMGAGDDYGRYRRICVEGPVLWAHEVDWSRYPTPAAYH